MAALDPDNYIKLFRLDDTEDSTSPENVVIIPAGKSVFRSLFHSESRGRQVTATMETNFPDEAINLLIKFRHELEELFKDCGDISGIAAVLWEDIARRLFDRGFSVSGKQCATKWEALHSDYLEIAQSDDEARVSAARHFAAFENLYKIRSKYIDSKILEDITEYLSSRSNCPSNGNNTSPDLGVGSDENTGASQSSKKSLIREDFSTLSNEDDSLMLIEAISAAQKILEDNLKDHDQETRGEIDLAEKTPWRCKKRKKREGKRSADEGETKKAGGISRAKKIQGPLAEKERKDTSGSQVFVRSQKDDFYWDSDATQCFLDLRLYVEMNKATKLSVMRMYKSIFKFVSQKMLQNGFKVSETDCRKKWEQLMRYYNKEVQKRKKRPGDQNRPQGAKTYFWQMDKVLKKSGEEIGADNAWDFAWDQESIRKLIAIRMPMENAFSLFKRYVILWQYVASQMQKHNFSLTYNECSIKWMELCEIYDICVDSVKRGAKEENVGWNFYKEMRKGFELNARNMETAINYKCNLDTEDHGTECGKTSTQRLAPFVFSSGSKTLVETVETESASSSLNEHLNMEQRANYLYSDTGAGQNTLETAIQHCDILENILKGVEVSATYNAPDPPHVDNNVRIITLGDSEVKPASGTPLLKFEDAFAVKKQFAQSYSDVKASISTGKRVEATAFDNNQNATRWTDEATTLMINFKMSRELKFRSSSHLEDDLWREIARDLQSAGHNLGPESCSARWHELMEAYTDNSNAGSHANISPKYLEQLKLMELPLTRNDGGANALKTKVSTQNSADSKGTKFVWTENAVRCLIGLKFSREIRNEKKYGLPIANKMRAAGFPPINPIDVSKKWSRLFVTYKKALIRKEMGQDIPWQYFELIDNHMKGDESGAKKKWQQFSWTPRAVQKLIDVRLRLESSCHRGNIKELTFLWKKIADGMRAAGFQVAHDQCAAQWSFLVKAYMKTKQELKTGNGAVIGSYFIMMDKALNQLNKLNDQAEDAEEPIDFSIVRNKRKHEDSGEQSMPNISEENEEEDSKIANNNLPTQVLNTKGEEEESLGRRWSEAGTHLLIDLKLEHKSKSADDQRPEIEWEEVGAGLLRLGHNYRLEECREKWNSLKTIYEQKIADIKAKRTVQTWPYFGKMDSFYKQLGNLYHGFRFILPKKRSHDGEEGDFTSPKKLALCVKQQEDNRPDPRPAIDHIGLLPKAAKIVVCQEKMI